MTKPTTHVLIVADVSGSMYGLASDVRGGFNAYLDELRADTAGKYRLTVALFDNRYDLLCNAAKLREVPRLDGSNYRPYGSTALLDAIGRTITDFESAVPALADGDRVLLVVQTDGQENASTEYAATTIRKMIADREALGTWSCIFLGAGPDASQQASGMGFASTNTVAVAATAEGTQSTYSGLAGATRSYSRGATGAEASGILADEAGKNRG